jgi:hypothetical protein
MRIAMPAKYELDEHGKLRPDAEDNQIARETLKP